MFSLGLIIKYNVVNKYNKYFILPCRGPEMSIKELFLEISQNSQENICARVSFLIKLQAEFCNYSLSSKVKVFEK